MITTSTKKAEEKHHQECGGSEKISLVCGRRGTDRFMPVIITQPESNVGVLYEAINGKKMRSGKI